MKRIDNIKKDMKELWKETFHDSDHYIEIVFDNYFTRENAFFRYDENRLIAALLRIPYEFKIFTKEGQERSLRGVYLCGLATSPEYRRRGIMGQLMKEAEEASKNKGYEVAFLIPADDDLRKYYERKGYRTISWRKEEEYSPAPNRTTNDETESRVRKLYIYTLQDFINEGKRECGILEDLADWCRDIELSRRNNTIVHSRRDMLAIMEENENTIFLSKATLNPEFPILANVVAVAFPELEEAAETPVRLIGLYCKEEEDDNDNSPIEAINGSDGKRPDGNTLIRRNPAVADKGDFRPQPSTEIHEAIMKYYHRSKMALLKPYLKADPEESGAKPYAMMKWLKQEGEESIIENLRIEISLMLD